MRPFPYQATVITLITAGAFWGLSVIGIFGPYDAILYELVVRHNPRPVDASPLLLITATEDERAGGDPVWLDAVDKLEALGARQIIFAITPARVSPLFYRRAVQAGNLVFGRNLQVASQPGDVRLAPWPAAAAEWQDQLTFGVTALPLQENGQYRKHQTRYRIQNQDYPSLEAEAAQPAGGERAPRPESVYGVNFSGGLDQLPTVTLRSLLAGELIGELVQGKRVLIGLALPPDEPGLHTPVDPTANQGISSLAFHGFALQTLIRAQPMRTLPAIWQLVILLATTALNVLLYQLGRYRFALVLTGAAVGFYALIAWLSTNWFLIWPPVTALLLSQIATFVLVSHYRFQVEEVEIRRVLLELSRHLGEPLDRPGFYASPAPWNQVVNLVKQTLDLDWLIFLERVPDRYQVKEVVSMNCNFTDIEERRRDYRRSPYNEAIAESRPTLLQPRLFVRSQPGVSQYLAPLLCGGELLGFWVMGVAADKVNRTPDFAAVTHRFSLQIADMLDYRRQWQKQQQTEQHHHAFRYLRLAGGDGLETVLRKTTTRYQQRVKELESVFDGMATAAVLFTPFGQAVRVNQALKDLLNRGHSVGSEMTALDLISRLCNLKPGAGQDLLRRLFLEHAAATLPARVPGIAGRHYLLHAQPVTIDGDEKAATLTPDDDSQEATPFHLRGILMEVVDVTKIHNINELKTQLIDRLYLELRNGFQDILLAAGLLTRHLATLPEAASYLTIITDEIDRSSTLLKRAQPYLFSDISDSHEYACYPVGPREPLVLALDTVADRLQAKRLTCDGNVPASTRLALADPAVLRDILQTILEILLEDAVRGSSLFVALVEEEAMIAYRLSAPGYGLPELQFQDYLHGTDVEDVTPLFRRLRAAVPQVAEWAGSLTGSSQLGDGLSFELRLRCFI